MLWVMKWTNEQWFNFDIILTKNLKVFINFAVELASLITSLFDAIMKIHLAVPLFSCIYYSGINGIIMSHELYGDVSDPSEHTDGIDKRGVFDAAGQPVQAGHTPDLPIGKNKGNYISPYLTFK